MPNETGLREGVTADSLDLLGPAQIAMSTGAIAADAKIVQGRYGFCGLSICETAASTAEFKIYDGNDATGTLLAHIKLASGQSQLYHFGSPGIICRNGVFVNRVAGTADLTVYVVPLERIGRQ